MVVATNEAFCFLASGQVTKLDTSGILRTMELNGSNIGAKNN